ncbi:helix-turn-helix domain-containing protein [Acuticoccus sp. I52.16.1]|uniref:winged helix-turn-helix transcriptional regulator n=1 Tax=Acuticoccus sp. I52.16.1 TaxID=2928472 RepID=UPI001FD07377|nr:helix-turn-helix domain-containing protein [Acuticoccus sp. I52.16.1]UOM34527.1 helix-turn-helix transcriptional regulator [Acuticoccus sp. I52.16.1]
MESEKITERESETTDPIGWSYNDACGAAHALDLVGERWTLLAMRELMMGPKRFTDLRASLPGISANVLTQRLTKLEAVGVVERVTLPPPAGRAYQLTPWGYEARPIFMVLGRWGARSPRHDPTLPLTANSILMSFETMLDAERAAGVALAIGLTIGGESFRVAVAQGALRVERDGPGPVAAGIVTPAAPPLAGWVYGGVPLETLEADGVMRVTGDRGVLATFRTLFVLPAKAGLEDCANGGCDRRES